MRALAFVVSASLVSAGGTVVVQSVTATPAHAAVNSASDWADAAKAVFGPASELAGVEKKPASVMFSMGLHLVGPVLGLFDSDDPVDPYGPQLDEINGKLDDLKNQIGEMRAEMTASFTQLNARLDAISRAISATHTAVLQSACDLQEANLKSAAANVVVATTAYQALIADAAKLTNLDGTQTTTPSARTNVRDIEDLDTQTDDFISLILPTDNSNVTTMPLSETLVRINQLLTDAGGTGVLTSCGRAALSSYVNAMPGATSKEQKDANGDLLAQGWVDDRQYYAPVTSALQYWQTVQAQALFLLREATLMKGRTMLDTIGMQISFDDAQNVCPLAYAALSSSGSDAETDADQQDASDASSKPSASRVRLMCTSLRNFTIAVHDNFIQQWKTGGVPYSDDDWVLALGSDITGLTQASDRHIPDGRSLTTTVWSRHAGTTGTFPWVGSVSKATGAQWQSLSDGFSSAYPDSVGIRLPVQLLSGADTAHDTYAAAGVEDFRQPDLLTEMATTHPESGQDTLPHTSYFDDVTKKYGDGAYIQPGGIVERATAFTFIPPLYGVILNDTAVAKSYATDTPRNRYTGLGFPGSQDVMPYHNDYFAWDEGQIWTESNDRKDGDSFIQQLRAYPSPNADVSPQVTCTVMPRDGVLCDKNVVGSWWVSRQSTSYSRSFFSNGNGELLTINQDSTVTPLNPATGTYEQNATQNNMGWPRRLPNWEIPKAKVPSSVKVDFAACPTGYWGDRGAVVPSDWSQAIWYDMEDCLLRPLQQERTSSSDHNLVWMHGDTAPSSATETWFEATAPETGTDCTTSWGVPTRCGKGFEAWAAANIPNPASDTFTTTLEPPSVDPTDGSTITGVAEPDTAITATAPDGTVVGTTTADDDGRFTISESSTPVHDGDTVDVISTPTTSSDDGTGVPERASTTSQVVVDQRAPAAPDLQPSTGRTITGTSAAAGDRIDVTDSGGTPIDGEATIADGGFTFTPTTPLRTGTKAVVQIVDAAGNASPAATLTIRSGPDPTSERTGAILAVALLLAGAGAVWTVHIRRERRGRTSAS